MTHGSIGLATGSAVALAVPAANPFVLLTSAFVGAALPDAPMIALYALDVVLHRKPMETQSRFWFVLKSIAQDLFLWPLLFITAEYFVPPVYLIPLALLCANGFIHSIMDIYTHGNPCFHATDGWYAWPFSRMNRVGWDYRIKQGQLWPLKTQEARICFFSLEISMLLLLIRLITR